VAQRCLASAEVRVQAHDGAVDGLLQRIEGEESKAGLNRGLGRAPLLLMHEQPAERLDGQLAKPLPLREEPLVERPLGDREPGQQAAAIEAGRLLQRDGPAVGDQRLEARHVDVDGRWIERHRGALQHHSRKRGRGQRLAERREGVAQVAAGLSVRHVAPQECGQPLPRVGPAGRKRQVGQQRLGLPAGQEERRARVQAGLEAAEQAQPEPRDARHRTTRCGRAEPGRPGARRWRSPR
jgi:hypothetical protein